LGIREIKEIRDLLEALVRREIKVIKGQREVPVAKGIRVIKEIKGRLEVLVIKELL
jgi:hypothetical protein